jgi:anti-anti-sigma factor
MSLSTPSPWDVREVADGLLVRVRLRDLDAGAAMLLFDALLHLVQERGRRDLYLDCAAVESMSSAVLGRLVLLHRKLRDAGGQLSLFNLAPQVREVLRASLLTDLLDVRGVPLPPPA